ncbi:Ulp1 family isopeptidase [Mesorhizobium sp. WSM4083]|uniref:Ulp1 family isopeptidase n=1 Tax=Mesorhizobium sp. WSM4083 TaxID=3446363 RepID=UPI003F4FF06E
MPAASAPQPAQATGILTWRSKQPLHAEDAPLILGLKEVLLNGGAAEHTARDHVNILLRFGRWLFKNNKKPIGARLDTVSLTDDAHEFSGNPTKLLTAIEHLRTWQLTGGVVPIAGRAQLNPHPEDVALIKEYRNEAATETGRRDASALRSFSDYLRQNNKKGIAGRLSGKALDEDLTSYKDEADDRNIGAALAHLRKSQAGAKAMELERRIPPAPDPEDVPPAEPMQFGETDGQHYASQDACSWPKELPTGGYDAVLLGLMDQLDPSPAAPQPAQSTQLLRTLSNRPLHNADAELMSGFVTALESNGVERAATIHVSTLLSFGHWLFTNNKPPISDRLDKQSLTDDAREFIQKRSPETLRTAMSHLRTWQSTGGVVPIAGHADPTREDAALIKEYRKEAATNTVRKYSTVLRGFSDYLRQANKKGIAGRLSSKALDVDAKEYRKDAGGDRSIGPALAHLRKSQAGARAMERERHIVPIPDPQNAPPVETMWVGEAAGQHSAPQDVGSWPKELAAERHGKDLRSGPMDEPGPSASVSQPARSTERRSKGPLHPDDAELISGLEQALINASEHTVRDYVRSLLSFGRWLSANNKDPIKERLGSQSLTDDAREFMGERNPKSLIAAMGHLWTSQSTGGVVPIAGRTELNPYPQDGALIKEYKNEAATDASKRNATALRSFSDYLRQNDKKGIAGRLSGKALDRDAKSYKHYAGGDVRIGSALAHLRKSQAGTKAMERERHIPPVSGPEDAASTEPMGVGGPAGQNSASQDAGSWPKELAAEGYGQDLSSVPMDEPDLSSSAPPPPRSAGLRSKQPLYPQDAELIRGLEGSLIEGGATEATAKLYVRLLRSFGHWLFKNNKTSIVAQLNNNSLADGGEVLEFVGTGDPRRLRTAIGHLETSRATGGAVPIAGRAKPLQILPADETSLEPIRAGDTATQDSAWQDAGSWPRELPAGAHDDFPLRPKDQTGASSSVLRPGLSTELRRNQKPLHPQDGALISGFENDLKNKGEERTAKGYVRRLRSFGHWLFKNDKASIVARLDNKSLTDGGEVLEFTGNGDPRRLLNAMDRLRTWRSTGGVEPIAGRAKLNAAPDIARDQNVRLGLTDEPGPSWSIEPAPRLDQPPDPGASEHQQSWHQGALARSNLLPSQELLINDERDTAEVRPAKRQRTLDNPQDVAAGRQPSEIANSGDRRLTPAPTHQPGASPGEVQDMMQAGHRSTSPWSPQMPLNFDWSMWPTSEPAPSPGPSTSEEDTLTWLAKELERREMVTGTRPQSMMPSPGPSTSKDDTLTWLGKELERRETLAGTRPQPTTQETAVLELMGTDDVQPVHRGQALPMSAPAAPARQPAMPATAVAPDTYRGLPLIDVTAPASPSSDARIGGLDRTASSRVAAGSVLGATEWLSDAHIQSDYDFLEQQLQGIDPALAARTRLVSPSVSHLLRHLGPQGAESTLLSIYHQSDAPADFLFLPVNNGTATRPGTHWSLLFVDGRNPQGRVAYHYDSLQQAGYNDEPAQQLAEGLTATLAPARMPRQSNDHDCGVFVVDGTWALVQRLLNGERPDHEPLHLDNLVADRQALQNRLTRRLPHEEQPRQTSDDEAASFEPGELTLLLDDEPASPAMMAFEPGELRLLLDDEPASSSPGSNSTPHAQTDAVHQSSRAPWLPERKT